MYGFCRLPSQILRVSKQNNNHILERVSKTHTPPRKVKLLGCFPPFFPGKVWCPLYPKSNLVWESWTTIVKIVCVKALCLSHDIRLTRNSLANSSLLIFLFWASSRNFCRISLWSMLQGKRDSLSGLREGMSNVCHGQEISWSHCCRWSRACWSCGLLTASQAPEEIST